jgi:uncharacterized NAD(P)/FAD-binding protein YdhS
MRSDAVAPVAVVGGGFSGTMTAVQLARRGIAVRMFEGNGRPGRGVAYGTDDPNHLLNVPAAKMSAWPDRPDDFADWLGVARGSFASRRDFGAYVASILASEERVTVDRVPVEAISPAPHGWSLRLADGGEAGAAIVVLALGNEPPAVPAGLDGLPLLANPWSADAEAALARAAAEDWDLLLIGTGLTAVDVMLSLDARGYRGRVVAVSRRGLLPRAHAPHEPAPVTLNDLPLGNLLALWRWLRKRAAAVGFRAAIDSLRPHSAALWQALPLPERRRFLRHARPWWDVHRHRLAPGPAGRMAELIASGRLELVAGRSRAEKGRAVIALRGGGERVIQPDLVVNCTGPLGDVRRSTNPLLRDLLTNGLVEPDSLALGLLADAEDRVGRGLWALGPLTKGMYWEMTAVPDIRGQAERVAAAIAKELVSHG